MFQLSYQITLSQRKRLKAEHNKNSEDEIAVRSEDDANRGWNLRGTPQRNGAAHSQKSQPDDGNRNCTSKPGSCFVRGKSVHMKHDIIKRYKE
jgi:hypothetical protein